MKRFTVGIALALAATIAASVTHNQAQAVVRPHKVLLCHGTASHTNPYVLISVDYHALNGHFDGTAPGHGKNNYPDFISPDGTCNTPPEDGGGGAS